MPRAPSLRWRGRAAGKEFRFLRGPLPPLRPRFLDAGEAMMNSGLASSPPRAPPAHALLGRPLPTAPSAAGRACPLPSAPGTPLPQAALTLRGAVTGTPTHPYTKRPPPGGGAPRAGRPASPGVRGRAFPSPPDQPRVRPGRPRRPRAQPESPFQPDVGGAGRARLTKSSPAREPPT